MVKQRKTPSLLLGGRSRTLKPLPEGFSWRLGVAVVAAGAAAGLQLEITESVIMQDVNSSIDSLLATRSARSAAVL